MVKALVRLTLTRWPSLTSVLQATVYPQNLMFHRNAFALAMVPMEKPAGAVDVARKSYKGF